MGTAPSSTASTSTLAPTSSHTLSAAGDPDQRSSLPQTAPTTLAALLIPARLQALKKTTTTAMMALTHLIQVQCPLLPTSAQPSLPLLPSTSEEEVHAKANFKV